MVLGHDGMAKSRVLILDGGGNMRMVFLVTKKFPKSWKKVMFPYVSFLAVLMVLLDKTAARYCI
jgi:hypothetical protein